VLFSLFPEDTSAEPGDAKKTDGADKDGAKAAKASTEPTTEADESKKGEGNDGAAANGKRTSPEGDKNAKPSKKASPEPAEEKKADESHVAAAANE